MKHISTSSILAVAALVLVGVLGVLVYRQHDLTSGTSLTVSASPAQPIGTPTPPTTAVGGKLKIPELGIELTMPTSLSDAYYRMITIDQHTYAGFSSHSLVALGGATCDANSSQHGPPLGAIIVSQSPPSVATDVSRGGFLAAFVKQAGNTYVYYRGSQDVCTDMPSKTANDLQASQISAFNAALQSVSVLP